MANSKYFWISAIILSLVLVIFFHITVIFDLAYYFLWFLICALILFVYVYVEFQLIKRDRLGKSIISVLLFGLVNIIISSLVYALTFGPISKPYAGDMGGLTIFIVPLLVIALTISSGIITLIVKAIARRY